MSKPIDNHKIQQAFLYEKGSPADRELTAALNELYRAFNSVEGN